MQENEVKAPVPEPEAPDSQTRRQDTTRTLFSRHVRKCHICNHSDRAAIEFDFINWRNPAELVKSFQLRDLSTIYRHAHATGLFARRRLNLRGLMERIAERVSEVPITAAAIIRAARAIAHINDAGEWIDPPTRIIVEHHYHSKRKNGSVTIKKVSHAMFTPANLDEPSPEAASCGERPRIDPNSKSPYPSEIVLEIDPVLYEAGLARKRRAEAACLAQDAKGVADPVADPVEDPERSRREPSPNLRSGPKVTLAPWKTIPPGVYDPFSRASRMAQPVVDAKGVSSTAPCPEGTRTGQPVEGKVVVSGTGSQPVDGNSQPPAAAPSTLNEQNVAASSSSLAPVRLGEQAASNSGAPSAHPTTSCKGTASAVPSSTAGNLSSLPEAAVPNSAPSALSVHEPRATQPASRPSGFVARAGSAGSTDPPYPFAPSPNLYRKGRKRHF